MHHFCSIITVTMCVILLLQQKEPDSPTLTMEDLLEKAELTPELYQRALKVSHRRTRVIMKRSPSEIFINSYNPILLKCLR